MSNKNEDLTQSEYNINVAFYVHLKEYNTEVRQELEKRISEVFFFSRGVDWKFDSFGIEKQAERKTSMLGYFIFRCIDSKKLEKLFLEEFKSYKNASKITFSIAKYQKIEEEIFVLNL